MTTTSDPMGHDRSQDWELLETVEWISQDIKEAERHISALRTDRLRLYRQGQYQGVSLRQLGEAAGCSGEAVSAALKRAEARDE